MTVLLIQAFFMLSLFTKKYVIYCKHFFPQILNACVHFYFCCQLYKLLNRSFNNLHKIGIDLGGKEHLTLSKVE